jgi:DNA cross-link repair 1A protein
MVGKKIDICYLDTTYLDARYCFPAQELVIDACSALVKQFVEGDEGALSRVGGEEQMKGEKAMRSWLEKEVKVEVKDEGDVKEEDGGEGKGKGKMKEEEGEKKPVKKERLLVLVGTYSIGKER